MNEKEYLRNKDTITMCIDPNWMPFESFDKNKQHIGMSADYFDIFQKTLNKKIEIIQTKTWLESLISAQERKCDMLSLLMQTQVRKQYLNFTSPYLSVPLVIATKNDIPFIHNLESLDGEKIGIPKGYEFLEILKSKYKNITLIEVDTIKDGLQRVQKEELFGYLGALVSVNHALQNEYLGELKIAGKFDETLELRVGIRNDDSVLLSIMQKAIQNITDKQHQNILNNWVSVNYEKAVNYTLLWYVLGFASIIILFITYRQYLLKKSNLLLEIKIQKALEESRKREQILQEQNKLASMGQMIGAIAHQWRQPLNEISTKIQNLKYDYKDGSLNDEVFIKNFIDTNKLTINFMSQTIDDFRNFFKVSKHKKEFAVYATTQSVLNMQSAQLIGNKIKVIITGDEFIYYGFQSEYQQVILNILNNAKDALVENNIDNPLISIHIQNKSVTIKDNAGGIPLNVLPRIFEPYFSTKEQGKGVGIGLYMSKVIIEKNMGASLEALNDSDGAMFTIKF